MENISWAQIACLVSRIAGAQVAARLEKVLGMAARGSYAETVATYCAGYDMSTYRRHD